MEAGPQPVSGELRAAVKVAKSEFEEPGKVHPRPKRSRRARDVKAPPRSTFWGSKPLLAGWLLVVLMAAVFVRYALFGDRPADPAGNGPLSSGSDDRGLSAEVSRPEGEDDEDDAIVPSSAEQSLEGISQALQQDLAIDGAFPAGTVASDGIAVEQRLSWLAVLADRMPVHSPVTWDKPWRDPMNDGFVRRRILEFQNPAIPVLIGTDGYPATHFVGIGGVGPDATRLDASDPRAGIFSEDRRTRLEEIRDGASNTWLALGVQSQLGSWAAGGQPTVRTLTQEPYVNGKDGFGTGQADSMLVLLADGRVQAVSVSADPGVLRSMATIADGLPASEAESSDRTVGTIEIVAGADGDDSDDVTAIHEDDPPLNPEFAPEPAPRKIDPAVSLKQPIVRFEMSSPRPLAELLPGLAELVGVPLRIDPEAGVTASALKTPIQLRLQETTIGAILEGVLKPAGLRYEVESDHLRIVPRD